jgi:hypothetical protein
MRWLQSRRGFGKPLFVRELVREQGEGKASPGELGVAAERLGRGGDGGKALRLGGEPVERRRQLGAALRARELSCEAPGGDGVEVDLAVRVAARREHEHGPAARGVQLVLVDADVAAHEPSERDAQVEIRSFELGEAGSRRHGGSVRGSAAALGPLDEPGDGRERLEVRGLVLSHTCEDLGLGAEEGVAEKRDESAGGDR